MDYVIDDISLIGLTDEKEYPVAEEYQPNGSNLDLVLGNGDIIQITDIGLSPIVKAGCV